MIPYIYIKHAQMITNDHNALQCTCKTPRATRNSMAKALLEFRLGTAGIFRLKILTPKT